MLLGLLNSKLNMPKVIATDRDTTMMNVLANVFPETIALLYHFHIEKNVRARYITDCRVKPKDVKVDERDKEVKEGISRT